MRLEIVPSLVAAQLGRLPKRALQMARLCDGTRTMEKLCADSRLPAETVTPILERLVALGVVRQASEAKRRPLSEKALAWLKGTASIFSDDEERFFASPIPAEE
jgi:hypothetical protein